MCLRLIGLTFLFLHMLVTAFSQDVANYETDVRPLLSAKCFECHNTGTPKGDVNLDNYKEQGRVIEDGQFWLKVLDQIKTRQYAAKKRAAPFA